MPKEPKSLARGKADIANLVNVLNAHRPGAGDQLSQVITHLNNRLDAQAGYYGTVAVAKQKVKDAAGNLAAGLDLGGNRLTGVAPPTEGTDAVNLQFFRRFEECDSFKERFVECLRLPRPTGELVNGPPEQVFPPSGIRIFVNASQSLAYYLKDAQAGGFTNNEKAGAIGTIDLTDKHAPVRIGYRVLNRGAGPQGFAVDEDRLIAFVLVVGIGSPGGSLLAAIDLSDPVNLPVISTAGPGESTAFADIVLGNKGVGERTYGYFNQQVIAGPISAPINLSLEQVWNLTNPALMSHVRTYILGGYGPEPISSDFRVNGRHFPFATDPRGIGTIAANLRIGGADFNSNPRSDVFMNLWDIDNPVDMQFLGDVRLGAAVELSGFFFTQQVVQIKVWGTAVFALVTIYDPDLNPDNPTQNHLFGIDCSTGVPVIKTDFVSPCSGFNVFDVFGTCLVVHDGSTDVLYDVSDLSDWQLIGGCLGLGGGNACYRPGHLYFLTQFGLGDPDPTKPSHGFTIQYFGENGIDCP